MPPITTIASNSPEKATEIGSAEVMRLLNSSNDAGEAGDRRRHDEGDQLVAVGGVAEEARALLVLADRDQHAADRRIVEAPQDEDDQKGDRGDQHVIGQRGVEIHRADDRPRDAAEPVLAAGHRGPAERDGVEHGGEREREQREIDAAPAQDERAEQSRDQRDQCRRRSEPARGSCRERVRAARCRRHRRRARTRRRGRTRRGRCSRPEY